MVCTITASHPTKKTETKGKEIMTDYSKRLLILDIEWRPTKAYVWQPWKENITPEKIIEHGGLLCFAAKWLGDREVFFHSDWIDGHHEMLEAAHKLLSEADAVVTYNGDRYDIPKLMGEFVLAGLPAPPPVTSIDLLKAVKKLGLFMNRLAFVGPLMNLGGKIGHEGMALWTAVEAGKPAALKKMQRYNEQDVRLTERLYKKIKPYIRNHPHLGTTKQECGACGSNNVQKRGFRRTKSYLIQRIQCQTCGSWSDGTKSKVT